MTPLKDIFEDWLIKNYPDKAEKVLHQIMECHGGKVSDSRFGIRMSGEGQTAEIIRDIFYAAKQKYIGNKKYPKLDLDLFSRPGNGQLKLF